VSGRNNTLGARLLLIDDDADFRQAIKITLGKNNYLVTATDSVANGIEKLKTEKFDLVITDLKMDDGTGLEILNHVKTLDHEIAVILFTAYGSIENAVEAMQLGAYSYLTKPFKNKELLVQIEKALENRNIREELNVLREEIAWKYGFDSMVGISGTMKQLKQLAARIAATDISILITGESGTGKELMAKAVHYHSRRRKNKFVPIDCTSIPENLLESEFFGHIKGSFTSAYATHKGLFEEADKGTIFLDEIGDMPLTLQSKILRVLQESEIRPVGATQAKKIDVRIIAATNSDLHHLVTDGLFREDLFYRLNVMPIHIPPLRDRIDDIAILIEHFIRSENAGRTGDQASISTEAMEKLIAHHWPGNVRELENTIKRAIALSNRGRIMKSDIMFITSDKMPATRFEKPESRLNEPGTLEDSLRKRIESTLYANNWNFTRTATKLGIGRTTLWRKIRKYNITKNEEANIRE
jgi:DNA-binding NtrC family response regulator